MSFKDIYYNTILEIKTTHDELDLKVLFGFLKVNFALKSLDAGKCCMHLSSVGFGHELLCEKLFQLSHLLAEGV